MYVSGWARTHLRSNVRAYFSRQQYRAKKVEVSLEAY